MAASSLTEIATAPDTSGPDPRLDGQGEIATAPDTSGPDPRLDSPDTTLLEKSRGVLALCYTLYGSTAARTLVKDIDEYHEAMRGPESYIVASIFSWLKTQPDIWAFKVHGGPHQAAGVPDIVGCVGGIFVAMEVKTPTGRATPLQLLTISKIKEASGFSTIVRSLDEAKAVVAAARAV